MAKTLIFLAWLVVSCATGWAERWPAEILPKLRHGRLLRAQLLQSALREQLPQQTWEGSTDPWLLTLEDGTRLVFRCQDEKDSALAEAHPGKSSPLAPPGLRSTASASHSGAARPVAAGLSL